MNTEPLGTIYVEEILQALDSGEIIEEYPEDKPYPSCLILGRTVTGRPLHTPTLSKNPQPARRNVP
jgi:hypothetical protein